MPFRLSRYLVALTFLAAISFAAQPPVTQKYYVFSLGSPLGGATSPVGINDEGWISGAANLTGDQTTHAVLWVGSPQDLGTLGGPNSGVEWTNHSHNGEVVGIAETADTNPLLEKWSCSAFFPSVTNLICLGFVWQNGIMSPLPTLGGYNGYASGVNNRGQVVGWAENTVHEPTCVSPQVLQFEAVIWGPRLGEVQQLPPYPGDLDGAATAINDKGHVVGISGICDNAVGRFSAKHAVLWQKGVPTDIGNFDNATAWNTPFAINNHDQIVGFANLPGDADGSLNPVAFFWSRETAIQQLPALDVDVNSAAFDINSQGQIVGESIGAIDRAVIWQNGAHGPEHGGSAEFEPVTAGRPGDQRSGGNLRYCTRHHHQHPGWVLGRAGKG